jgi:hypothetical protein
LGVSWVISPTYKKDMIFTLRHGRKQEKKYRWNYMSLRHRKRIHVGGVKIE